MLRFDVIGQELRRKDDSEIAMGSDGYLQVRASFTPDWDETTKYVVVTAGGATEELAMVDDVATVPGEFLKFPILRLRIIGRGEGGLVISTNTVMMRLER